VPRSLSAALLPLVAAALVLAVIGAACGGDDGSLTIYSGRSETLVGPILERFSKQTGIDIRVRYGETAELTATILEEGDNSPADIFFAQDAGALSALQERGRLQALPQQLLALVPTAFSSPHGLWVGISGRARVVVYNPEKVAASELPDSILGFTDSKWKGRIGWPPTNGSFQAFVTALRLIEGEQAAAAWLRGIEANNPKEFPNNTAALQAVANGEVHVAFINHYYLFQAQQEQGSINARNYYLKGGDAGGLVNVAGAAILDSASNKSDAERFIEFMLSREAQEYFAMETFEYPLVSGVSINPALPQLAALEPPQIDLSNLSDLEGTLKLLRDTGVLP